VGIVRLFSELFVLKFIKEFCHQGIIRHYIVGNLNCMLVLRVLWGLYYLTFL